MKRTALRLVQTAARAPLTETSDAELLQRFCRDRDGPAFREILRRYESLVRGASRRLTRDTHAVDDAVQTTFLTLARKAHAIRHAPALPSWLYRVARSVTARTTTAVPHGAELVDPAPSPLDQLSAREVLAVLDEELTRLPAAHRSAVLMCLIEGNTVDETARRLGTTTGAIRGWLQRGRETLRHRLSRRGVELSAALPLLAIGAEPTVASPAHDALVRGALASHRPVSAFARLLTGSSAVWVVALGALITGAVAAASLVYPRAGDPPVPPKAATEAEPKTEVTTDKLVTWDGLPEGAVARIGSPRLRHAGEITAMAYSRDGRLFATASPASRDKSVRVWDMADGKEKYRIPIAVNPHENPEYNRTVTVAFAADDKRLFVLDPDGFRSFDTATGRQQQATALRMEKIPNQFAPLPAVQNQLPHLEDTIGAGFSPDAKTYAVVHRNGQMVLGDTTTGEVTRTAAKAMTIPENAGYSRVEVLFAPNGSEVCVPAAVHPIPLFDVKTGESKRALAKEISPYGSLTGGAFAADGRTFISTTARDKDGSVTGYAVAVGDIATGKVIRTIPLPEMPRALSVSPNGKLVAVGTQSSGPSQMRVLDLESSKEIQSAPLALSPRLVTFSPDSRLLAGTCYHEGRVTVWDLGKNASHPQSADNYSPFAFVNRSGHVVLTQQGRGTITVDWRNGKVMKVQAEALKWALPPGTAESRDGGLKAEVEFRKDKPADQFKRPGTIVVKETATGQTKARLEVLSDAPQLIAFADQNRLLVTATRDDVLTVWDVASGKPLWSEPYPARAFSYAGEGGPVYFTTVSNRMAIGWTTEHGTVIDVWELHRRTRVSRTESRQELLAAGIAFSPDGTYFASGRNESATLWHMSDGRTLHTLGGHAAKQSLGDHPRINCQFSADGRKLLTVDGSGTIRVWECVTGQLIRTFSGHNGPTNAHFSPDSRLIAGASFDAPVFVWDLYGLKAPPVFNADRTWTDLADASPATAFRAVRELCAVPKEAIALLKEKLPPESLDAKVVEALVKDLSSEQFADRERATTELGKHGESIVPLLRQAHGAATDAESRQRLAALLGRTERPSPADLRIRRAMDALEHLGTSEAQEHLEALGRGTPGCLRTVLANEALARTAER